MKKIFLLISILTLVYSCSSEDDNIIEEVGQLENKFGIWEGEGMQLGLTWTIKITLNSSSQLIEYPSIECGGFLTLISETDIKLLFRETITFNNICFDQGFVELIETSETTMDYNYYFPNSSNEMGELGATGSVAKLE